MSQKWFEQADHQFLVLRRTNWTHDLESTWESASREKSTEVTRPKKLQKFRKIKNFQVQILENCCKTFKINWIKAHEELQKL